MGNSEPPRSKRRTTYTAHHKIQFRSTCPPICVCKGTEPKDWHHTSCLTQSYIDNQGDISCEKGCGKFFIQHAGFKCEESQNFEKFRKMSEFAMAMAMSISSAELKLSDQDQVKFIQTLNTNVARRWLR